MVIGNYKAFITIKISLWLMQYQQKLTKMFGD